MKFSSRFRAKYPLATVFLKKELPMTQYYAARWAAFQKWSELSEEKALKAITLGNEPTIDYRYLGGKDGNSMVFGLYRGKVEGGKNNTVYLSHRILRCYEMSSINRDDILFKQCLVMITLHEMVHWGDLRDQNDQEGVEEGEEFVKEALGSNVSWFSSWDRNVTNAIEMRTRFVF